MAVFSFVSAAGQCLMLAESSDPTPVGQEGFALLEIDTGKAYRFTSGAWVCTSTKSFAGLTSTGSITSEMLPVGYNDERDALRIVARSLLCFAVDKLGYVPDNDRVIEEYERSVR